MENLSCDPDLHVYTQLHKSQEYVVNRFNPFWIFSLYFYRKENIFKILTSFRFFQFLISEEIVWISREIILDLTEGPYKSHW